jgi:hypothetical protein
MERKNLAALPVVKTIPQGLCQRFHAGRPTTKRKGEAHEWLVDSGDNCNLVLASGIHFA